MVTSIIEKGNELSKRSADQSKDVSKMISEIHDSSTQLHGLIDNLTENLRNGKLDTVDGISLLDVKNQLMLNYLTNITYVMAKKCHGKRIEGDAAVDRLVEIRTVVERIRPLEHKLKYTMEKLVKTALTGITSENDPTHFRANPDNMMDKGEDKSDSDSADDEENPTSKKPEKKLGMYVPPKLAPMHYDEDESGATRRQKQLDRERKRALGSSVMQELREEYLDTPVEVSHGNALRATTTLHHQRKTQYEEEYFTRLPTLKKEKHRGRHSMTVGNIADQLTHFDNLQVLEDENSWTGKRKRKSGGKSSSKKSFKKKKSGH